MKKGNGKAIKVKGIAAYVINSLKRKYTSHIVNAEGEFYLDEGYWITENAFFEKYPIELQSVNREGLDGRTNWRK